MLREKKGCDGSGGGPQGDLRTQPRLPVTASKCSIRAAAGDLWANTARLQPQTVVGVNT